ADAVHVRAVPAGGTHHRHGERGRVFSPPPLCTKPRASSARTSSGRAVSQPRRSPGPTVLANDPTRTTVSGPRLHSDGGARPSYPSSRYVSSSTIVTPHPWATSTSARRRSAGSEVPVGLANVGTRYSNGTRRPSSARR